MTKFSNYSENGIINHLLRNTTMTSPATVYLALYEDDPTDADVGTEIVGGSYARVAITFIAPANGVTENNGDLVPPLATADWGTITHVAVRDALTGGNMLFHGPLDTQITILNGQQFKILSGDLVCSAA